MCIHEFSMWRTVPVSIPHESLNNMTPEEYRQQHYLAGISKNAWN